MATIAAGAESIPMTYSSSKNKASDKDKSKPKAIPIPRTPPRDSGKTKIYRSATGTLRSLTPRPDKDEDGLSFYLSPPSGKYFVTTVEDVNATGFLTAVIDGENHCSVRPTFVPTKIWAASRGQVIPSFYTLLLMTVLDGPYYG